MADIFDMLLQAPVIIHLRKYYLKVLNNVLCFLTACPQYVFHLFLMFGVTEIILFSFHKKVFVHCTRGYRQYASAPQNMYLWFFRTSTVFIFSSLKFWFYVQKYYFAYF